MNDPHWKLECLRLAASISKADNVLDDAKKFYAFVGNPEPVAASAPATDGSATRRAAAVRARQIAKR